MRLPWPPGRFAIHCVLTALAVAVVAALLGWWIGLDTRPLALTVAGREVELLAPRWLYLAALLPGLFLPALYSLTDLSLAQQLLSAGLRAALCLLLVIALARPVQLVRHARVATVALVDVSASISDDQLAEARTVVAALERARKPGDWLRVVTFAQHPQASERPGEAAIARLPGAGAGTDIQAALQLSYGLLPAGHLPRVLVLSDGNQTQGDVVSEAYRARELGVRVSWQTYAARRTEEIRVVGITAPGDVKMGAPFDLGVEVWSTHDDEVTLALSQDEFPNPLEPRKTVRLREGRNRVVFRSQARRAGHATYRARLLPTRRDREKANNEAVMSVPIQGKPRVLYVEGGLLNNRASASFLEQALRHESIDVETRGPGGIPSTAAELGRFDLVLVSDLASHQLGIGPLQALESYVRDLGGGLIVAGGEDSFGSGGYQGTRMEKLLPVRFDSERQREQPNLALALVIDRSGSMSGPKLEAAKESARATAEVLSPSDLLTVIAFDNQPTTVVRLQRASNRLRISTDISRLQAGGGTSIYPALQEAHQLLQTANAKIKHVILLSDGQAPHDGIADLCQEMRAARITVSAVGIGDADRNLLNLVAENGEGRLYMTDDLAALPRIFMKETTEAQRSALVEESVQVQVVKRVEMIEGTGVERAPLLRGYVSTKAKPTGEVVLASHLGEPLLARWRVGTGTAVAWTSDVKNRWSVDWIRWQGFPRFWAQVIRTSMRRKIYDSYDLRATVRDGRAEVVVDAVDSDDRFVNELDTTLEIIDPRDAQVKRRLPMAQTAPGRYSADFTIDRYGSYLLKAVHRRAGQVAAESLGGAALSYPQEYLRTSPDPGPLRRLAEITGGHDQPAPAQLWDPGRETTRHRQDVWPHLVLAAAALLILDLYGKRVRLFGHRTRPW
jgi:Mg-chelatase subunit ChlD